MRTNDKFILIEFAFIDTSCIYGEISHSSLCYDFINYNTISWKLFYSRVYRSQQRFTNVLFRRIEKRWLAETYHGWNDTGNRLLTAKTRYRVGGKKRAAEENRLVT